MTKRDVDGAVGMLAAQQHGVFTRGQALGVGAGSSLIDRRLRARLWVALAEGVYTFPSAPASWERDLAAASLALGPGTVVSHRSAAALHGWPSYLPGPVEVSAPYGCNARSLGTVHRSMDVSEEDCTELRGLPVTTQLRTVIDMASLLRRRRLEWLVDDLLAAQAFTLDELGARFTATTRKGKPGMAALRLILEERGPGYVPPASRLERLAFDCLVDGGLAVPVRQHPLPSRAGPGRVDLAYPDARLIIEADSRRWHTRVADFEVDRRRDNEATALGWQVLRVTWRDLVDRPGWVRSMVRSCLEAGSPMTDTRSPRASRRIPGVPAPRTQGLEVEAVR